MFSPFVNTPCNNAAFSRRTMRSMTEPDRHPSIQKLYATASDHGDTSPAQVARRLNVSAQVVQNWETRGISKTGAMAAQRAYGIDANWLLGEKASPSIGAPDPDDSDWANIKGYALAVGLGNSREAIEYAETHHLKFRADSLARKRLQPDKLAVLYGKGDSMLPRIHEGDAILFDTSDTRPADGELFVIALNGAGNVEYNVKRCEIVDEMVFFRADNPTGDHNWRGAKAMSNKRHPITIVGRVRWIGSWEG
jgi:phage repressor protein C with HTH and peptisase S24 domain